MKTDLFQHEVVGVTRTLGRAHDLDLVFEGESAGTDGTTIKMPALPSNVELSNQQARAFRGFADHEAMHVRHSDMTVWERTFGKDKKPNPLLEAFANACEDMRVERLGIDEYPGVQKNLAATAELTIKRCAKQLEANPALASDPAMVGPLAITLEGRRRMGTATTECEELLSKLDPDVVAKAKLWNDAIRACRSTDDVVTLARRILGELPPEDLPPQPEPQKGKGKPNGKGGGDDRDGEGQGKGTRPDEIDNEGGDNEGGTADEDSGGGFGGSIPCLGKTHGEAPPLSAEFGDTIKSEAKTLSAGHDKGRPKYRVYSTAHDKWHTRHDRADKYGEYDTKGPMLASKKGERDYEQSIRNTRSQVSVMRRKLERMLLAKQRRDWDVARETGFIDPKRLSAAALGVANVFRMRTERADLDTAATILVDLSGSMSGSKVMLAQQVAIALATCLDTIGIPYSVLGFSNQSGFIRRDKAGKIVGGGERYGDEKHLQAARKMMAGRIEPLDMFVFKAFDERLVQARSSMGAIHHCVGGNNSDGDAVQYAWGELRKRRESRKLLLTLSDGAPANTTYGPDVGQHLRNTIQSITDQGCECVGIGIMDENVKRYYPRWAIAESLDDLAGKTMDTLAQALLGERTRVTAKVAA
jgi:cobaltochelatase CobT subunit